VSHLRTLIRRGEQDVTLTTFDMEDEEFAGRYKRESVEGGSITLKGKILPVHNRALDRGTIGAGAFDMELFHLRILASELEAHGWTANDVKIGAKVESVNPVTGETDSFTVEKREHNLRMGIVHLYMARNAR